MKSPIRITVAGLLLALSLAPTPAMADRRERHAAIKLCKQNYKEAVRGAKYLKGRARRERIEQARLEREECKRLAKR